MHQYTDIHKISHGTLLTLFRRLYLPFFTAFVFFITFSLLTEERNFKTNLYSLGTFSNIRPYDTKRVHSPHEREQNTYTYNGTVINFDEVLTNAKDLSKNNTNPVLLALINNGYVRPTMSWLCNTKHMNFHQQILLVTTDDDTRSTIKHFWPKIRVVSLKNNLFDGSHVYGHAGYTRMLIIRTMAVSAILRQGVDMLLFETDSVWLTNPFPFLFSYNDINLDFIINQVSRLNQYCPCFLYIFSTNATISIFVNLAKRFQDAERILRHSDNEVKVGENYMDQIYLTEEIDKYPGIRIKSLPVELFEDGRWYICHRQTKPVLIQNNWVLTVARKIKRLMTFGHWFLKEDNTCDYDQVQNAITDPTKTYLRGSNFSEEFTCTK